MKSLVFFLRFSTPRGLTKYLKQPELLMDAAFSQSIDVSQFLGQQRTRSATMPQGLSEPEFEKQVAACLPRLIQIARRLSSDDEISSEAVQRAMLRASRAWGKFAGRSHVSTWLTRIVIREVRRLVADQKRRRMKTNSVSMAESSAEENGAAADVGQKLTTGHEDGPQQQAIRTETRQLVHRAVGQLPERQREVFVLTTWQGMTAKEVGSVLKIKEQNVYANLHAARQQLRNKLQHVLEVEQVDGSRRDSDRETRKRTHP